MPQPLSSVLSRDVGNVEIHYTPNALDHLPHLAALVAKCIARWANIELSLGSLLIRILDSHAVSGHAMFSVVGNTGLQFQMISAAAEAVLADESLEAFGASMIAVGSAYKRRNKLAHCVWAFSPHVPKALLLAEPDALQEQWLRQEQMLRGEINTKDIPFEEHFEEYWARWHKVFVYDEAELRRLDRDLEEVQRMIGMLFAFARPPAGTPAETREQVRQQLYSLRLFQEALDRWRARQKNGQAVQP